MAPVDQPSVAPNATLSVDYLIIQSLVANEIVSHSIGAPTRLHFHPPSEVVDERKIQVISATVAKLWADLKTMADALRVFRQTILNYIEDESLSVISQLNEAYRTDSVLGQRYQQLLQETNSTFVIPSYIANEAEMLALTKAQKKVIFETQTGPRQVLSFVVQEVTSGATPSYGTIARACWQLAKNEKLYVKIQAIFNEAINEAAASSYKKVNTEQENIKLLFMRLKQNIMTEPDLRTALEKANIILPDKF